jgi:hypothetical protein
MPINCKDIGTHVYPHVLHEFLTATNPKLRRRYVECNQRGACPEGAAELLGRLSSLLLRRAVAVGAPRWR